MEKNTPKAADLYNTPDVTVILTLDGVIVNGNNGILGGLSSELGKGVIGRMVLGY